MLLLAAIRRTPGIFLKAGSPRKARLGQFQVNGTCISRKGLEQRRDQHRAGAGIEVGRVCIITLSFLLWVGAAVPAGPLRGWIRLWCTSLEEELGMNGTGVP